MHSFGLNSLLEEGATMFKFLILMKDAMNNNHRELNQNLIAVIWTLIARETKLTNERKRLNTSDQNPYIPKLLESLYNYNPKRSLTKLEYIQLFQIEMWV